MGKHGVVGIEFALCWLAVLFALGSGVSLRWAAGRLRMLLTFVRNEK